MAVTHKFIPQFEPWLGQHELAQLTECIDANWITGGVKVKEFEKRMAELVGVKHAVACMNGTVAIYMALRALGIGEGDEVIVPDFTFIASSNAVLWAGAIPIFCDVDRRSLCIGVKEIENKLIKSTKAIMPVGIYGNSPDMTALMEMARQEGVLVIEDAAQDIGVSWKGKALGSWGNANAMSYYSDKTLTTSEGGMVFTDDESVAEKCRILKHQGRPTRGVYIHDHIGFNLRMTDLQAAIGLAQFDKLPEIISKKLSNEILYKQHLFACEQVAFPEIDKNCFNVPFRCNILVDDPGKLSQYLDEQNIQTRRFFYPLHKQPCYKHLWAYWQDGDFPNSIWAYEHGLSLPSSVKLSSEDIEYVCDCIRRFYA